MTLNAYQINLMALITRKTDYALQALVSIAKQDKEVVTVTMLVDELGLPKSFLRGILQCLNRAGLLSSTKGKMGGFKLAKPPHSINLLRIMEILEGPISLSECRVKDGECPKVNRCLVRKKISSVEKYIVEEFRSITIEKLIY